MTPVSSTSMLSCCPTSLPRPAATPATFCPGQGRWPTGLCSTLLAWLDGCSCFVFLLFFQFKLVIVMLFGYHPLIFKPQVFLNMEKTELASVCASGWHSKRALTPWGPPLDSL